MQALPLKISDVDGMRAAAGRFFARAFLLCVAACTVLAGVVPCVAYAQPAGMPQPALVPSYSPLCDSNLVPCLDVDDFAAHAYAHLMVLPQTEQRETAVSIPYGIALGLFGRLSGGVSTNYTFWPQEGTLRRGHGSLRLSTTLLLWPLFPLRPQVEAPPSGQHEPHFIPPRHLRIGVTYEHELRAGPFEGANSLGLLMDLSALRLVTTKAFGPVELTLSLGALIEPRRLLATGEVAAQVGLYLPFFKALKFSIEGLARGVPSFVHPDLLADLGEGGIRPQRTLGLALSYRPHARVDLGVSAQMGVGGMAPSVIIARFAVLSVGKTYEGRAATPITQLVADATARVATEVREYIASLPIDPMLDEQCIIRDDDGSYMGRFGARSADRHYCEHDGFKVPIGHELLRDTASDRLCRDSRRNRRTGKRDLYDCVLWRRGKEWLPAHQATLNDKCELRESDGRLLAQVGTPSANGTECHYPATRNNGQYGSYTTYQDQPIGEIFYTDSARSTVCENPNLTRCFIEHADGRGSLRMTPIERIARGAERGVRNKTESAQSAAQTAEDVATGKVSFTTIADEVKKETTEVAKIVTDPDKLKAVAKEKTDDWLKSASDWWSKPSDDKLDDAGEWAAGTTVDGAVGMGMGAVGHVTGGVVDTAGDLRKLSKKPKVAKRGKGPSTQTNQPAAHRGEPPQLAAGKRAHREEPVLPGEQAEVPTPSGRRMDRYDEAQAHIREIKPNNPRQLRSGQKQVDGYRKEMEKKTGRSHTTEVTPYDPDKYR